MAKVKGLKRINKIINKFTEQFGIKAVLNDDFEAHCGEMIIGYTFAVNADDGYYFLSDVAMRYPDIEADIFLWSLMHEIGHCMTDSMWTEEELEYFWYQKERMTNEEKDYLRNDWYHATPDEFFATKWAGEYMLRHQKKICKFWNKLQPAIERMYRLNGVTDEA